MQIKLSGVSELTPDPANARKHSARNLKAIASSLEKFGQVKPIVLHRGVVIAGNGTLEAAKSLGWAEISTVSVPDEWDSDTASAYALADNRTAELAEWNDEILASQLVELQQNGWEISDMGFDAKEMEKLASESDGSKYTAAINIPQYEIVGDEPEISQLFDSSKAERFESEILKANLPKDVEDFLIKASYRHIVFNYRKIAEYYPHATPEVQGLIEESALVIIDAENAIRNAYADFLISVEELEAIDSDRE